MRFDSPRNPATNAGTESQRAVGRYGPESLGLGACREAIGRVTLAAARIGTRPPHLLAQRLEQRCDIDRLDRGAFGF